jgi:hypothetical protein
MVGEIGRKNLVTKEICNYESLLLNWCFICADDGQCFTRCQGKPSGEVQRCTRKLHCDELHTVGTKFLTDVAKLPTATDRLPTVVIKLPKDVAKLPTTTVKFRNDVTKLSSVVAKLPIDVLMSPIDVLMSPTTTVNIRITA